MGHEYFFLILRYFEDPCSNKHRSENILGGLRLIVSPYAVFLRRQFSEGI